MSLEEKDIYMVRLLKVARSVRLTDAVLLVIPVIFVICLFSDIRPRGAIVGYLLVLIGLWVGRSSAMVDEAGPLGVAP